MKRSIKILVVFLTLNGFFGCNFLDVVPDNVATIENAFSLRSAARKFLFTTYSYLPSHGSLANSVSFGGMEMWPLGYYPNNNSRFVMGQQNVTSPLLNYWEGMNSGTDMWQAIRDCNIFLENIQNVPDMQQSERDQWEAEVKFLKAYYHFFLMQLYGPIPIVRENIAIDAPVETVRVARQPVDDVVDYIVELLDEAMIYLPNNPLQQIDRHEYGRATKMMAMGIKAKVLTTAASPLFNGNADYADYVDPELGPLFNQTYSAEKWQRAMEAAKEAIDNANAIGLQLFYFQPGASLDLSEASLYELNIREAFSSRDANINGEIIWPNTNGNALQTALTPRSWDPTIPSGSGVTGSYGPTLQIAELFYTDKGLPIDQDNSWDYNARYDIREGDELNKRYVKEGYQTVRLHFNREPRFYSNIGFDGGIWYGQGRYDEEADVLFHLEVRGGRFTGPSLTDYHSPTGYYPKKPINYTNVMDGSTYRVTSYLFPILRLTDVYLLYIEAANELNGPNQEILGYLNDIRARAGIPSVQESWDNYSNQPGKYNTKEGLREIIRQERRIELNNEAQVYWDLLRWKIAENVLSRPMMGWNKRGASAEEFYQPTVIYQGQFQKRDYFMPIREYELLRNEKLLQSPGW